MRSSARNGVSVSPSGFAVPVQRQRTASPNTEAQPLQWGKTMTIRIRIATALLTALTSTLVLGNSQANADDRYAMVKITNTSDIVLNFDFRFGDEPWQGVRLDLRRCARRTDGYKQRHYCDTGTSQHCHHRNPHATPSRGINRRATPLLHHRSPVGAGPSLKMCP